MKKYKVGYTQGTFDLFHIGHLNLLNNAKKLCDYLIVGVNTDRLVKEYKCKDTIIKQKDRIEIVANIKAVDDVILTDTLDKLVVLDKIKFDVIFIGDDWKNNERWINTKNELAEKKIDVVFLPYTKSISTTQISRFLKKKQGNYE